MGDKDVDELWSATDEDDDRVSLEYSDNLECWIMRIKVKHGSPSDGHVVCLEIEDLEGLHEELSKELAEYKKTEKRENG